MRIPRKIKTILIPIVLTGIGIFLVINVLNIQNSQTMTKPSVLDIQRIVGISQIILGIATALIALPAASDFLLKKNRDITGFLKHTYFSHLVR
ncbi:MAG: hypothetical protein WB988_14915 [Candidatus Nitrosopolaris sp.]